MFSHHLDRAVARATGESPAFIRRRGFSIIAPRPMPPADDSLPKFIDWDAHDDFRFPPPPEPARARR